MKKQKEEIVEHLGELQVPNLVFTERANGSIRVQQDFSTCPTMAEQHTAHLTDVNYLIERFKPDELAAYVAAKSQSKIPLPNHDWSKEPDSTGARNILYQLRQAYRDLPEDVRIHFKDHVEYLKFIDNPANAEKMIKLGFMTRKQVEATATEPNQIAQQQKEKAQQPAFDPTGTQKPPNPS